MELKPTGKLTQQLPMNLLSFLSESNYFFIFYPFRKTGQYDWTKFRSMAHLEKKYDDTMTEYYRAFCAMLKRTCGVKLTAEEGNRTIKQF